MPALRAAMVRRIARRGANSGQAFWGCGGGQGLSAIGEGEAYWVKELHGFLLDRSRTHTSTERSLL